MGVFEFTFALNSVVLGLALTQIAAAAHKLLLAGRRAKWAAEPVLLAFIVLLVIVTVWLGAWDMRGETVITVGHVLLQITKLLTLYFASASVLPDFDGDHVDLFKYYDRTRLLSFGALIASLLLFIADQMVTYGLPNAMTIAIFARMVLYPILYISLIFIRARWFNILVLSFVILYYGWQTIGVQITT
ncbi:hypothetical protein HZF05_09015 [Sphingomonas sp. CGMCC 1.13654]|uniref:Uncharacterized protein n=1 Tax=Sphingomonas chungangi TaxID=2683589 RepID=A0A838L5N8_9SPHN|nr:hypothetical protein [Sphingomonas chungangi]MBA2934240.1 hypothetical protein [Sphingomonas chungangi]MVW57281.1 hypothetical protein [Sphingomonas chungangi]